MLLHMPVLWDFYLKQLLVFSLGYGLIGVLQKIVILADEMVAYQVCFLVVLFSLFINSLINELMKRESTWL
jgi:hypothetical protein